MLKRPTKAKGPKTDWAAKVRKYKPQMNALTDEERARLLKEGLEILQGQAPADKHGRGG